MRADEGGGGRKPRILLVDDDDGFRQTARYLLVRSGYEVVEARNGKEALQKYASVRPDLVITDLIMPEKEGVETIIELRRMHGEVRVIAVSGGGRMSPNDYLPIARNLGARATLAKPFPAEVLLRAVEGVLRGESLEPQ